MEIEQGNITELTIDEKIQKSQTIIHKAFERFDHDRMAIAITGGKDSTANLWLFKWVCQERGIKLPRCMFIDEGDVFEEIMEFVNHLKQLWSLEIIFLRNEDVYSKAGKIGDLIEVSTLNESNRLALKEMNFSEENFPFIPDSPICNHLMKTLPMREFIINQGIQALSTAIRWDEIISRELEEYFSPRNNPDHLRVHPILHFRERDIWIANFKYDIPFNKLYKLGYRSLGARCATHKNTDVPAWMQDLENTPERVGRGSEKEKVMDQLRSLGYM
jgi:phosphoadenosine phosphosulfate reductase